MEGEGVRKLYENTVRESWHPDELTKLLQEKAKQTVAISVPHPGRHDISVGESMCKDRFPKLACCCEAGLRSRYMSDLYCTDALHCCWAGRVVRSQ